MKAAHRSPATAPEGERTVLQGTGRSQESGGGALEQKSLRFPELVWLGALLTCALAVAALFAYCDVSLAERMNGLLTARESLATGFASMVLLAVEATIVLLLVVERITRGHLSPLRETTALACLTSICAYAINDSTLKRIFGVPNPGTVLRGGALHAFNLLSGSANSSFPSGHMVLAGAFAGVFMRLYRRSVGLFAALLAVAAALLILGNWHFASDVVAGTFVGITAGLLAGEVWLAHSR